MGAAGEVFDNLVEIFRLHVSVPVLFRVDHEVGTFLAGAEAHVGFHFDIGQPFGGEFFLQCRHQRLRPTRLTIDILTYETSLAHKFLLERYLLVSILICNISPRAQFICIWDTQSLPLMMSAKICSSSGVGNAS